VTLAIALSLLAALLFAAASVLQQRGTLGFRRLGDIFAELFLQARVIFRAVEGVGNGAGARRHGGRQSVLLHGGPVFRINQIDAFEPDAHGCFAQVIEAVLFVAPARHRLFQAPLERRAGHGRASGQRAHSERLDCGSTGNHPLHPNKPKCSLS